MNYLILIILFSSSVFAMNFKCNMMNKAYSSKQEVNISLDKNNNYYIVLNDQKHTLINANKVNINNKRIRVVVFKSDLYTTMSSRFYIDLKSGNGYFKEIAYNTHENVNELVYVKTDIKFNSCMRT